MFLVWLHTPANQMSWYKATGVFPADSRFPASAVKDPLAKQLLKLDTGPKQFWLENYLPPQVDSNGVRVATQSLSLAGAPSRPQPMRSPAASSSGRSSSRSRFSR